jgi:purine-binding chemotaxis protein CheW
MASVDNSVAEEEVKMLTFSLDNVFYGVDVNQVREVKNFEGATPVPCAPSYVKGVTNLRGEVVPVIHLRTATGHSPTPAHDSGIMVVVQDKHPIGVIVDSVIEVLTLRKKDVETDPESLLTDRSDGVIGIAKHDNDLIVLLDIIKVLSNDNLSNMKESMKGFQIQVTSTKKQLST